MNFKLEICVDSVESANEAQIAGADRLFTSGQKNSSDEGSELIRQLVSQAGDRIIIMPGGGISDSNIERIAKVTGAKEFHLTGRKVIESKMIFRKQVISMGGVPGNSEFSRMVADKKKINRIISILKAI